MIHTGLHQEEEVHYRQVNANTKLPVTHSEIFKLISSEF